MEAVQELLLQLKLFTNSLSLPFTEVALAFDEFLFFDGEPALALFGDVLELDRSLVEVFHPGYF
jgi:hypothetical protein